MFECHFARSAQLNHDRSRQIILRGILRGRPEWAAALQRVTLPAVNLGRLTRQELGWLLAQEARGAAQKLRVEVGEMRSSFEDPDEDRGSSLPGELSLDVLDNAIDVLGQLQATPRTRRKGHLDLGALLYELAPNWRVVLAPGSGTQVFGDEEEFRRMLQLLLTQSGLASNQNSMSEPAARAVEIRRDGQWVRVTTPLGPDTAATMELERRWLARMAMRLGGRYELHGKSQSLVLPAESDDRLELKALKEELHQAQQLGQSYARELAEVLTDAASHPVPTTDRGIVFDCLQAVARSAERNPQSTATALAALSRVTPEEAVVDTPLDEAMDGALTQQSAALQARGVQVAFEATGLRVRARPTALSIQLGLLLQHCADAPNPASVVRITAHRQSSVLTLAFQGAPIPSATETGPLSHPRNAASSASLALLAAASLGELGVHHDKADGDNGAILVVAQDGQPRLVLRLRMSANELASPSP